MALAPPTSQSQKQASAECQAAVPATRPATEILEPTAEPADFFWADGIALQVWLACTLLMWLIGLASVLAGLSQ